MLDSDQFVVEVILGFPQKVFQYELSQLFHINSDEFLDEAIHAEVVNCHTMRHFRYQTYPLKMLLFSNQAELKQMDLDFFSNLLIISTEAKKITMFVFINNIMSKVYKMIHNIELPRVLEEMKNKLQFGQENRIGN